MTIQNIKLFNTIKIGWIFFAVVWTFCCSSTTSIEKMVLPATIKKGEDIHITINLAGKEPEHVIILLDNSKQIGKDKDILVIEKALSTKNLSYGKHIITVEVKNGKKSIKKSVSFVVLASEAPKRLNYKVVKKYFHNPKAFTQGLTFYNGYLYESTGQHGTSYIVRMSVPNMNEEAKYDMSNRYFGEGITVLKDKVYQLTYQARQGFVYDALTLKRKDNFRYKSKEGWGLTDDGENLIMSNGTDQLIWLSSSNFEELKRITVTDNKNTIVNVNELEYDDGIIYANVWLEQIILQIDAKTGKVLGYLDLKGLHPAGVGENVLNGIAIHPETGHLFVTGKLWDAMYEIKIEKD